MKAKLLFLILLFTVLINNSNAQLGSTPYSVWNDPSAPPNQPLNIRNVMSTIGNTPIDHLASNSKLVATSYTPNVNGFNWYSVDIPGTSSALSGYCAAWYLNPNYYAIPECSSQIVTVGSNNLFIRPSAGNISQNVTISGTAAKVFVGQRFVLSQQTTVGNDIWYEIYLTSNCNQSTGWVAGYYQGSTLSTISSQNVNPLPAPILNTPTGANITANSISLTWSQVDGATSYSITSNGNTTTSNTNSTTLNSLTSNTTYIITVKAIYGSCSSPASNQITVLTTSSCSYLLSSLNYTFPNSNGGSNNFTVTTQTGCNWTASVTLGGSWLSTSSSGTGTGTVTYSVTQNTGANSRTGTIDVNGQTFTITQPGISCSYTLSSGNYTFPNSNAANNNFGVTTQAGCNWTASVTLGGSWLSTSSSGTGSGTVTYSVTQNTGASSRTGTIDVNGQTFSITQPGISCSYVLSGGSYTFPDGAASSNNFTVTTQSGCNWTASVTTGGSWLSTSSSGTGSGTVNYSVTQNTGAGSRTGTIDVNGQTFTVTQPGSGSAAIAIILPNGGENLSAGSSYNITVSNSSNITQIDFYYSPDNGINWYYISSTNATPTTTTYPWIVNYVPTTFALVKAVGHYAGSTVEDVSDAVFTISVGCISTTDDYPYNHNPGFDCNATNPLPPADDWNFFRNSCTSWAAWKVNQEYGYSNLAGPYIFTDHYCFNFPQYVTLGNAGSWNSVLTGSPFYFNSDHTPKVGSIAWYDFNAPGIGQYGHVAFVNCVSGNGNDVTLTEYNGQLLDGNTNWCIFGTRTIHLSLGDQAGNRIPTKFIHVEVGGMGSGATAINELNSGNISVQIYPNPSSGELNIHIQHSDDLNNGDILIYNSVGQLIQANQLDANKSEYSLDLSVQPNGLYLIQLRTQGNTLTKRIELFR